MTITMTMVVMSLVIMMMMMMIMMIDDDDDDGDDGDDNDYGKCNSYYDALRYNQQTIASQPQALVC